MEKQKYHVGLGLFGIYAGTLKNDHEWKSKSCVTKEAIGAVAEYMVSDINGDVKFTYKDKKYVMRVEEVME